MAADFRLVLSVLPEEPDRAVVLRWLDMVGLTVDEVAAFPALRLVAETIACAVLTSRMPGTLTTAEKLEQAARALNLNPATVATRFHRLNARAVFQIESEQPDAA